MAFLKPELPVVDFAEWSRGTRSEKIEPMARHWAEVGFGTPVVLHLFYVVKIALYILGGWLIALSTTGIDGFTEVGQWWREPIVFEKIVLYTMAFEVIGLGCGFGPLNNRFFPPMGSILYWLWPGTIRLPPWPKRIPLTRGDTRTRLDVVAYAALLAMLLIALFSDGTGPMPGSAVGLLPAWQPWLILALLGLIGLRDKTIFLAARGEVYGALTVACALGTWSAVDMIVAAKLIFLVIWIGAATSKLNRHFPFVISTMMSNNPLVRPRTLKRRFFTHFPDDLRPGTPSIALAHVSTAIEMCVPLVLFFSHGGRPTAIAAFVMVCFHLGILLAIPMGVPLEWNVFMIFGVLTLFVGHADLGVSDLVHPDPVTLLFLVGAGTVVAGNLFPRTVSFLPGMRYYAGNWDTSLWCIKPSAAEKISANVVAIAAMPAAQLERIYGNPESAQILMYIGYAFRGFNTHGKALFTLAHRAMAGYDEDDYTLTDGERICSTAIGWNFGDGHMHNEQLIAALQRRCHFEPGEVRVVLLDAQPIQTQTQRYRLVDAATGQFESGHVRVADMVERQPWDDDVPVFTDGDAGAVVPIEKS